MIRAIVYSTFPFEHSISRNPDDQVVAALLDISRGALWATTAPVAPPKVRAREVARLYLGDDVVVVVDCPQEDFQAVRQWMVDMGLLDPDPLTRKAE